MALSSRHLPRSSDSRISFLELDTFACRVLKIVRRAGVDINAIRAWLGHVSLNTTNTYAEVGLEMKAKALATCQIRGTVPLKHWIPDSD
jgi:hypothetical protein